MEESVLERYAKKIWALVVEAAKFVVNLLKAVGVLSSLVWKACGGREATKWIAPRARAGVAPVSDWAKKQALALANAGLAAVDKRLPDSQNDLLRNASYVKLGNEAPVPGLPGAPAVPDVRSSLAVPRLPDAPAPGVRSSPDMPGVQAAQQRGPSDGVVARTSTVPPTNSVDPETQAPGPRQRSDREPRDTVVSRGPTVDNTRSPSPSPSLKEGGQKVLRVGR
jgi:hypothetical protein